jgi:hypothetical protein
MKNILSSLVFLLFSIVLFAQAPQGISYQAVARKANGEPITGTSVNVQFRILNGGAFGTEVYRESHTTTTNGFGLFTLKIGGGSALSGTFATINWANGAKFLEVTVQSSFGTVTGGATEMLSVPFALYAASAGGSGSAGASEIYIFEEQYPHKAFPTTATGVPPVMNSFNTRNLNTTAATNPSAGNVTLGGSGQLTFRPGRYLIEASAPAFYVNRHKLFLRKSDNIIALTGTNEYARNNGDTGTGTSQTRSFIKGILVVSENTTYKLDHYIQTMSNFTGPGIGTHLGIEFGQTETVWDNIRQVLATIMIQKIQ